MNETVTENFSDELSLRVMRLVLYPVVFIVGVLGNLVTLCITMKRRKISGVNRAFIINLCFSDLLVLAVFIPFDLVYLESSWVWPFGLFMCKFLNPLTQISVVVSGTTLAAIGYERYRAIVKIMRRKRLSSKAVQLLLLTIWVYAVAVCLPFALALHLDSRGECIVDITWWPSMYEIRLTYLFSLFVPEFVIPALFITFFYISMAMNLRKHNKRFSTRFKNHQQHHVFRRRFVQNTKTLKLFSALVVVFIVCILPQDIIILMAVFDNRYLDSPYMREFNEFCRLLSCASSSLNPIMYGALNRQFLNTFKSFFQRKKLNMANSIYSSNKLRRLRTLISRATMTTSQKRSDENDFEFGSSSDYHQPKVETPAANHGALMSMLVASGIDIRSVIRNNLDVHESSRDSNDVSLTMDPSSQ